MIYFSHSALSARVAEKSSRKFRSLLLHFSLLTTGRPEIKEWRGCTWSPGCTWLGGADAAGQPHGPGVMTWPDSNVDEGVMESGRRQGPWVQKNRAGSWWSFQCKDDVEIGRAKV